MRYNVALRITNESDSFLKTITEKVSIDKIGTFFYLNKIIIQLCKCISNT